MRADIDAQRSISQNGLTAAILRLAASAGSPISANVAHGPWPTPTIIRHCCVTARIAAIRCSSSISESSNADISPLILPAMDDVVDASNG